LASKLTLTLSASSTEIQILLKMIKWQLHIFGLLEEEPAKKEAKKDAPAKKEEVEEEEEEEMDFDLFG